MSPDSSPNSSPDSSPASLARRLVGTWRLVAFESHRPDRPVRYPFGPEAVGILVYTADGIMSGQLMRPGRQPFAAPTMPGGTDADLRVAALGYVAYAGPYDVDEARAVVRHHVIMSLFPNLVGTVQERTVVLDGDRLTLVAPDGARIHWRRSEGTSASPPQPPSRR
jgi:hypothetical protein